MESPGRRRGILNGGIGGAGIGAGNGGINGSVNDCILHADAAVAVISPSQSACHRYTHHSNGASSIANISNGLNGSYKSSSGAVNGNAGGGGGGLGGITSLISVWMKHHQRLVSRFSLAFLGLCTIVAMITYQAVRRESGVIRYTPQKARVPGLTVSGQVMGKYDCIPADMMLGGSLGRGGTGVKAKASSVKSSWSSSQTTMTERRNAADIRATPMIATNLDHDTENYLTRFVSGIDAPVDHKLIAWGGCDPMVADQVNVILQEHPDYLVYRTRQTLGCASGWNTILQYMSMHDDIPWVIIFNSDMYTPPGSLAAFTKEIWAAVDEDPHLCVGLFNTRGAGTLGRYTAYVYTRHALNTLGTFDANIYPAYYEDVELDIRIARAQREGICSPFRTFNSSEFEHGKGKQTKKYLSGSKIVQQRMMDQGDQEVRHMATLWSDKIKRGKLSSPPYLQEKWGCRNAEHIDIESCTYDHPFDNPDLPLSYWVLDAERRRCIDESSEMKNCPYTLFE